MSVTPIGAMSDAALQAAPVAKARGYWATVGRRIARDKVSMICAFILLLIFLSALIAPWLGLADPYQGSMIRRLRHIGTAGYPLGTDELGRDMLARLIYGGRLSLIIGISPVVFAFCIGTSLGLGAGYAAGLSFLGLGTKPPEPEWGLMLNTLRTAIYVNPWVAALPGAMIFAVSICFNLVSDGLRSAMDIRN